MDHCYWEGTGRYQEQRDRLFALLVPKMGEAKTKHGETLRCAARIYYDIYNNYGWNLPSSGDYMECLSRRSRTIKRHMETPSSLPKLLRAISNKSEDWALTKKTFERLRGWLEDVMDGVILAVDAREKKLSGASTNPINHDLTSLTSGVQLNGFDAEKLVANLDAAFAKLPKPRDDSHYAMLGAAAAIARYVNGLDPERVIPEVRVNRIFEVLYPWISRPGELFPRYFTAQSGHFKGDRLYIRCDDKERSVFVLKDGTEEDAGGCCRYGACVSMAVKGDWQELTANDVEEMFNDTHAP